MAILLNRSASVVFVPYITLTSKCWEREALKADVFCSAMCCSVLPCPQSAGFQAWSQAVAQMTAESSHLISQLCV